MLLHAPRLCLLTGAQERRPRTLHTANARILVCTARTHHTGLPSSQVCVAASVWGVEEAEAPGAAVPPGGLSAREEGQRLPFARLEGTSGR